MSSVMSAPDREPDRQTGLPVPFSRCSVSSSPTESLTPGPQDLGGAIRIALVWDRLALSCAAVVPYACIVARWSGPPGEDVRPAA